MFNINEALAKTNENNDKLYSPSNGRNKNLTNIKESKI